MQKRSQNILNAFVLLVVTFLIVLILHTGIGGWIQGGFELVAGVLGKQIFGIAQTSKAPLQDIKQVSLENENRNLREQLVQLETLKRDNAALSDQFQNTSVHNLTLVPAHIVSMPRFIPGISFPDSIIIDQGKNSQIKEGMGIIVGQNFLGKITHVSENLSEVTLASSPHMSFSGKTTRTGALGVVRGQAAGDILFDNVLPSEDMKTGDMAVTIGDMSTQALGTPGNLIVGKIISVDKKPSAIFQTAKIKSLVDVTRLSIVFVVVGENQ